MDVFCFKASTSYGTQRKLPLISPSTASFETACQVFFDPLVCLVDTDCEGERRDAAIGLTEDWTLLFIVHVLREEDVIRIISARLATPQERRTYEDHD